MILFLLKRIRIGIGGYWCGALAAEQSFTFLMGRTGAHDDKIKQKLIEAKRKTNSESME